MKKIFTTITLSFIGLAAFSQLDITIKDDQGTDITGGTYTVQGQPAAQDINAYFEITNNEASTTAIRCQRYELNVTAGTDNYFCWGTCLGSVPSGSEWLLPDQNHVNYDDVVVPMNPGQTFVADGLVFAAYHVPNGTIATNSYRYVWRDTLNPSDSIHVDITFISGNPTSVETPSAVDYKLGEAMPNPASENVMINYDLNRKINNANIQVYNMLGAVVATHPIAVNSTSLTFNVNDLHPGVYFYTLVADGEAVKTKRLVVR